MESLIIKLYRSFPWPVSLVNAISWLVNAKYCIGVLGIILNDKNEILLLHHTYRGRFPWGLPGGVMKRNESAQGAIIREFYEETGMKIRTTRLINIMTYEKSIYFDVAYECALMNSLEEFKPSVEVSGLKFFTLDQLPEEHIYPEHLVVILQLIGMLSSIS